MSSKEGTYQKQDLAGLNRDTKNSLNKLGEIFDKDSIEERQELANLFGELAYNQVHYMKGTDEQKAMYHAVIGGIMSQLTNGDFLAGASATAVNKLVMDEIKKVAGKDAATAQWLSGIIGGVVSELVSNNAQAGSSTSANATKNNDYGKRPEYTKKDGNYIYIPGKGWFVYENGKDVYTQTPPPDGVPYWESDDENASLGWDYIRKDIGDDNKIDEKILYSRYIKIDGEVIGVTIYTNNDNKKKVIIKEGMKMLAGALSAKTAGRFDSIDAVINNININDGMSPAKILLYKALDVICDFGALKAIK